MKRKDLVKLVDAVNGFYWGSYFASVPEDGLIVNGEIGMAYTDYYAPDGITHELSTSIDIDSLCWVERIDDEVVSRSWCRSLDELIDEISRCSYDDVLVDVREIASDKFGDEIF